MFRVEDKSVQNMKLLIKCESDKHGKIFSKSEISRKNNPKIYLHKKLKISNSHDLFLSVHTKLPASLPRIGCLASRQLKPWR